MKQTVLPVLAWTGRILMLCIILAIIVMFPIVVGMAAGVD
jgi:hypothetical protein